jgi:hypothetical protein
MRGAPRGRRFAGGQDGQQTRGRNATIHRAATAKPDGGMSAGNGMCSIAGGLVFRRIVDIPFEVCAAALESWSWHEGHDGELLIGRSVLRGPIEHDPDSDTCRIEVRLARGPLRSLLRMRLDVDRWSASPSNTALELIPSVRVRPAASYFRAGHLLLDRLTHRLRLERDIPSRSTPYAATRSAGAQPSIRAGATW